MTTQDLDADVLTYAVRRGITEVLHFTTNRGLLGILAKNAVLSRSRVDEDQLIEHIYTPNCADRLKDIDWLDYVNLSISRVNGRMLGVSQNWHATDDLWWAVLAFDTSLLAHAGVYFTTTNNTYSGCVRRGTGVKGLSALFAESVEWGHFGSRCTRWPGMSPAFTTDPQAEVLYPQAVSLAHLRHVYVYSADNIDTVRGWLPIFKDVPPVAVEHRPEVFQ